ncbi:MAG: tyrosine-type recombinase/integrase [Nanoarchaeota archaeon]|nr:tyrosine-type recombinase/integrase [Nanoarchaeota archaeon]
MDIHNYKRQLERQTDIIKESKDLLEENKAIALRFKDHLLSEGIGAPKIVRYLIDIRKLNSMLRKPFGEANKEDIRQVVAEMEQTDLAPQTKKGFKIMLRKLYRFLRGIDEKGVYPEEVKWISIAIPKNQNKVPEELLTEEEMKEIIRCCGNVRDKALISSLAESGCRVSEIGTLKIKHVTFEEYGARLTVQGKTGMRRILIINSTPYLQEWINQHPKNNNPEAYLWYNPQNKELLTYARITAILKGAAHRAEIKKRIYPHLLRHSRATILASTMTEASMKQYLGWGQDSKMCATYIHLNGQSTDEAILRASGIEVKKEKKDSQLKPLPCLRCKTINEATNKFCKLCGLVLDKGEAHRLIQEELEKKSFDSKEKEYLEMFLSLKKEIECLKKKNILRQ